MTTSAETLFGLIERHEWKAVFMHLQSKPKDASATKPFGSVKLLPLHRAIAEQAPLSVIRTLVAANAGATKVKGENGYLPLHYACRWSNPQEPVISILLGAYATAASVPDDNGMLPLHMVCMSAADEKVIDVILAAHPEGMNVADKTYHYPLDYVKSSSSKNKVSVYKALDHASVYCNISKTATSRTTEGYEAKLRKMKEEHSTKVAALTKQLKDEKDKSHTLEDILNSSDIFKEKKKVESLTEKMEKMKAGFDAERAESKKQNEELKTSLKAEQEKVKELSAELEVASNKVEDAVNMEKSLTEEVASLKGELECRLFKLREVTCARDASNERVGSLESRLSSVTKQNHDYEDQNHMLKGMLKALSAKVQGLMEEHEAARQTLAARSLDLKSIVVSGDVVLERARVQGENMVHTKIDIENILHFVDDGESTDTSDTVSSGSSALGDGHHLIRSRMNE